jgi:penicillin V acylase-like amidase (Ntn superfamily)
MAPPSFIAVATVTVAVLTATPGIGCTTLCLLEKGRVLVAYNYDAWASEGLILVNKRGMSKQGRVKEAASWTAKYGSVTFNQFGRDEPSSGVNENGLMASATPGEPFQFLRSIEEICERLFLTASSRSI